MIINKKIWNVNSDEFTKLTPPPEFNNLKILNNLGLYERLVSFCCEIFSMGVNQAVFIGTTHGGFIPLQCLMQYDSINGQNNNEVNISLINTKNEHQENIQKNIIKYNLKNNIHLKINTNNIKYPDENLFLFLFTNNLKDFNNSITINHSCIILVVEADTTILPFYKKYTLLGTTVAIYVSENKGINNAFQEKFKYYLNDCNLTYDNLINLCVMVKNGGPQFENMLLSNIDLIDRWTILDTGSTDGTQDIIKKILVGKKQGTLYEEPFINFKDSRNQLLDYAGKTCKYTLMLDDTYIIQGNLRNFMHFVRGDQFADSFSLYIESNDTQYATNRIVKCSSVLRYLYKIHEVITDKDNINVIIPANEASIHDGRFEYMEKRTMDRKQMDLKFLYEELEENPMEPRTYYYLAQTYNLMENYQMAFNNFLKRAAFTNAGFIQERIDALFEAARLANFKLNKPWEECLSLYEQAFKSDESRPEPMYFIGMHYLTNGEKQKGFDYFKKAYKIGYPVHCQYSLKPTLSFHFLPKILASLCYDFGDYELGLDACKLYLLHNKNTDDGYNEIVSWLAIYEKLTIYNWNSNVSPVLPKNKPLFVFIADGGFGPWTGSTILTKGVGGSETYIIEMARWIERSGRFSVIVFCNCVEEEVFEGVLYKPLHTVYTFLGTHIIQHVMVSRYSEYLPVAFKGHVEHVYFVIHDLTPSGIVIPMDVKLKKIFCLTEWHVGYFTKVFPQLEHLTVPFYYGIDTNKFKSSLVKEKVPFQFIYSSFPNRGLLPLLQMWPKIIQIQPKASLLIFSDINGKWVNGVEPDMMKTIRNLIAQNSDPLFNIHYYGWVDKQTLAQAWITSEFWFYPCTFMETFCLTALEAALTKTCVISNGLAALENTVANRGIIIPGDPNDEKWQKQALEQLEIILHPTNAYIKNDCIERNYNWASQLSWENQASNLLYTYILPNSFEFKGKYDILALKKAWDEFIIFLNETRVKKEIFEINKNTVLNFENKLVNNDTNKVKLVITEQEQEQETDNNDTTQILQQMTAVPMQQIVPFTILEIGTHTGLTLIYLISQINDSIGIGIDAWDTLRGQEIQNAFFNNIGKAQLSTRVRGIKGYSTKILLNKNIVCEHFDLIYVNKNVGENGSNDDIIYYSDLVLSWTLVNSGGYLVSHIQNKTFELFQKSIENEFTLIQQQGLIFLLKK
jgi:hypothetical protein